MVTEAQYRRREKKATEEWRDRPQPWRSLTGSWEQMIYETFASPRDAACAAIMAAAADAVMSTPLIFCSNSGVEYWVCSKQ